MGSRKSSPTRRPCSRRSTMLSIAAIQSFAGLSRPIRAKSCLEAVAVADSDSSVAPRPAPGRTPAARRWLTGLLIPKEQAAGRVEKRALFSDRWVRDALNSPQLLLIFTFFYWPTGEALWWAFTLERPWGGGNEWVGFGNFNAMLTDAVYWSSIVSSVIFAAASTGLAMAVALVLAILTDRELRGSRVYRSVLV